jgi:toxin CptA
VGAALPELKYSEAVAVRLGASRRAALGLAAMALATLALIGATPGPAGLRVLLATGVICAALDTIHAIALHRGRRGVRAVVVRRSREIAVEMANGRWRSGVVRDGSFVAPWLTIIRWRPEDSRFTRSIVLVPGMLAAETFRSLRVLLRWA